MITVTLEHGIPERTDAEVLTMFAVEDAESLNLLKRTLRSRLGRAARILETAVFTGKPGQVLTLHPADWPAVALLVVGLGPSEGITLERLRRGAALAAKTARSMGARSVAVAEPDPSSLAPARSLKGDAVWEEIGTALTEGILLGLYRYDRYKTAANDNGGKLTRAVIVSRSRLRLADLKRGSARGRIIADAVCLARDLANAPANEIYPETLAKKAREVGRRTGVRVTVLDTPGIRALKMGGLLGVSAGSARPPRFIIMEHHRGRKGGTVALVGKGVTFDSGGISIKPSTGMAEMRMDMAGAAAVIATMQAVAQLKIPVHVVGLIPATENLPSGTALKPGDILTHLNGMTSEVDNTDAEGRLILADAIAYAQRYSPEVVIDLATLTGACVVALGHVAAGMMGTSETHMARLKHASEKTHERVWELPLFEEYERLIRSDVADVKNVGGRWAGAITGALFLKKFAGSMPWVHLDIAGPAMIEDATDYTPRGGSGYGVRLLTEYVSRWKNQ
jgi:leucyl aminopeptidase